MSSGPKAEQAERFVGTGDLDGFFRTAAGPGWALLGDAGYHTQRPSVSSASSPELSLSLTSLPPPTSRGSLATARHDRRIDRYG